MKRLLLALRYGLAAALILGLTSGIPFLSDLGYWDGQLYRLSALHLLLRTSRFLPVTLAAVSLILLVYRVAGFQHGLHRSLLRTVGTSAVLAGTISILVPLGYWRIVGKALNHSTVPFIVFLRNIVLALYNDITTMLSMDFAKAAIGDSLVSLILAGVLIIFGGCYGIKHVHAPRTEAEQPLPEESRRSMMERFGAAIVRVCSFGVNLASWACILLVIILCLSTAYLHAASASKTRQYPNVVLIMVDALRADQLGCYGHRPNITPNIDELARHSLRAERAVSQAPWTAWSVASFMTSRYPETMTLGQVSRMGSIKDRAVTMAELLKDAGYSTGAVVPNPNAGRAVNLQQGFDFFDETVGFDEITSKAVADSSLKWISKVKQKRFFLFSLFLDCHGPYYLHPEYNFDPGYTGRYLKEYRPSAQDFGSHTPREIRHMEALYDSEIAYTDRYIGYLISNLKQQGLYDNTIIILLSDHGEEFHEHGGFEHARTLYDEVTTVPFIIKLPHQTEGRVLKGTFPLVDMLPSLLGTLGLQTNLPCMQGKDDHLAVAAKLRSQPIYRSVQVDNRQLRSIEQSPYKYILDLDYGNEELYDLGSDPREKTNLVSKLPAVTKGLRKTLLEHEKTVMSDSGSGDPMLESTFTDRQKQQLKSLGYLQ